jgi:hypothetical protein
MDAAHFRKRASEARAMAGLGEDVTLMKLLLEVANDLDAEADVIEAGMDRDRRASVRIQADGVPAILRSPAIGTCFRSVLLYDLSLSGARLSGDATFFVGMRVILEVPSCGLHIAAHVVRVAPHTTALVFDDEPHTIQVLEHAIRLLAETADARRSASVPYPCEA